MSSKKSSSKNNRLKAVAISVGIAFFGVATGILPHFERKFYDSILQVTLSKSTKNQIVIVGLTEDDIENLRFPVTDKTLADLLDKIDRQNPSVIGLDLHRNKDIGKEDNKRLDEIFARNQKLIGVQKANGGDINNRSIPPAIQLKEAKRSGASNLIHDPDNIVRRAYLYIDDLESEDKESSDVVIGFGLLVAFEYLENLNIFDKESPSGWLQLGNTEFVPLKIADFFYPRHEIDNDQILINYSSYKDSFEIISFSKVLNGNIPPDLMTDKIVLIGATAETLGDTHLIPYPITLPRKLKESNDFLYGLELHGMIINQIITAVLNDSKIMSFANWWLQYLWVITWIALIIFITEKFCLKAELKKQEKIWSLILISGVVAIIISGYGLFLLGQVFPTITSLCIFLIYHFITYILIRLNILSQNESLLKEEVKQKTKVLEQTQKKILEQKKFEVYFLTSKQMSHNIINKISGIRSHQEHILIGFKEIYDFLKNHETIFKEICYDELVFESTYNSKIKLIEQLKSMEVSRSIILSDQIKQMIKRSYNPSNQTDFFKEKLNINQLLEKIASEQITNERLTLKKDYDLTLPEISCVTSEIENALACIIDNACFQFKEKFNKVEDYDKVNNKVIIAIKTKNLGNYISIQIWDNATGIKPEIQEKIFESFWTTKSSGEGMGLGLYIAKEAIEKHGGSITVESEVGEWTEFTVTLPVGAD